MNNTTSAPLITRNWFGVSKELIDAAQEKKTNFEAVQASLALSQSLENNGGGGKGKAGKQKSKKPKKAKKGKKGKKGKGKKEVVDKSSIPRRFFIEAIQEAVEKSQGAEKSGSHLVDGSRSSRKSGNGAKRKTESAKSGARKTTVHAGEGDPKSRLTLKPDVVVNPASWQVKMNAIERDSFVGKPEDMLRIIRQQGRKSNNKRTSGACEFIFDESESLETEEC